MSKSEIKGIAKFFGGIQERTSKPCEICKKSMFISAGQEVRFHKQCRKSRHKKFKVKRK